MLGKLLKYDLKWIYKLIGIFYILAFIASVVGRGLASIENSVVFSIISQIIIGFAVSMMISSLINCLMRTWVRFTRNIYKDESYLTHTLPVEKKTIYASKVLAAIICTFTTVIVSIVCLFICYYSEANMQVLKSVLELAASTYDTTVLNLLLLLTITLFVEILFIIVIGFVGIILGNKSNQNKMAKSILIGFALYTITQVVTLGIIGIVGVVDPSIMNLINTTEVIDINAVNNVIYLAIGIYTVYTIFYYILGQKQLEKGVNVE